MISKFEHYIFLMNFWLKPATRLFLPAGRKSWHPNDDGIETYKTQ
jgi:hypothetical protein